MRQKLDFGIQSALLIGLGLCICGTVLAKPLDFGFRLKDILCNGIGFCFFGIGAVQLISFFIRAYNADTLLVEGIKFYGITIILDIIALVLFTIGLMLEVNILMAPLMVMLCFVSPVQLLYYYVRTWEEAEKV
jgi:hypothetical protein